MTLTQLPQQRRTIWESFNSLTCPNCKGDKKKLNAFCRPCYFSLPKELQKALWQRFGEGFENAYNACLEWFADKKAKTK